MVGHTRTLVNDLICRRAEMATGTFPITLNTSIQYNGRGPMKNSSNKTETSMLAGSESEHKWLDQCIQLYRRVSEIFRSTRLSRPSISAFANNDVSKSQILNLSSSIIVERQ